MRGARRLHTELELTIHPQRQERLPRDVIHLKATPSHSPRISTWKPDTSLEKRKPSHPHFLIRNKLLTISSVQTADDIRAEPTSRLLIICLRTRGDYRAEKAAGLGQIADPQSRGVKSDVVSPPKHAESSGGGYHTPRSPSQWDC